MRKTKIVCTMGPNTNDREMMVKLVEAGMNIARFNFSHGDHEEQKGRMDLLKEVREEVGNPVAILLDTKGPEIRTGALKDGKKVTLVEGNTFVLTTKEIDGDDKKVSITYEGLTEDIKVGNKVLIDDGLIELEVVSIAGCEITCTILNGGELGSKKGVNVPNVPVRLPAITEKDKEDILFGASQEIDFIAASFVRNAECVLEIKALLRANNYPHIPIIAKIENAEGIKNIDEIIQAADGIMVARGDLGVEIPEADVPHIQKVLISKCNENFKPVITATQMLDSMMRNPRPTRAEVTDVANAVYDGTDAVMLSGETAQGKYPLESLNMMKEIVTKTESHLDYDVLPSKIRKTGKAAVSSSIGYASVSTAQNVDATCIVTPSVSGTTAKMVSKFKPLVPIIGVTPNETTLRRMQIYWGVVPMKALEFDTTEEICSGALDLIAAKGIVQSGDVVVLTAGIPSPNVAKEKSGISNMMQITVVE
ncbi:MAG: pyruvate kinase [Eubacteriales bacterium]